MASGHAAGGGAGGVGTPSPTTPTGGGPGGVGRFRYLVEILVFQQIMEHLIPSAGRWFAGGGGGGTWNSSYGSAPALAVLVEVVEVLLVRLHQQQEQMALEVVEEEVLNRDQKCTGDGIVIVRYSV